MKKRLYACGWDKSEVEKEGKLVYVTDVESGHCLSFPSWKAAEQFLVKLGYVRTK